MRFFQWCLLSAGLLFGSWGLPLEASQTSGNDYSFLEIRSSSDLTSVPLGNSLGLFMLPDVETGEVKPVVLLDPRSDYPACTPQNEGQRIIRVVEDDPVDGEVVSRVTHRYQCLCSTWVKDYEEIEKKTCAEGFLRKTFHNLRRYKRLNPNGACSYGFSESERFRQFWVPMEFQDCDGGGPRDDDGDETCIGPSYHTQTVNTIRDFQTQEETSRIRSYGRNILVEFCEGTRIPTSYRYENYSESEDLEGNHHFEFPTLPDNNPPD